MRRLPLVVLFLASALALPKPPRAAVRASTLQGKRRAEGFVVRGGGVPVVLEVVQTLKTAVAAWLAASVVYMTTLKWSDRRLDPSVQKPLPDLGFRFVPAVAGAGAAADVLGSSMALYLVGTGLFGGSAGLEVFRKSLVYCAWGMVFSSSLHTGTMLPDSCPAATAPDVLERARDRVGGAPGAFGRLGEGLGRFAKFVQQFMGGSTDKLMSNHVFNTGLAAYFMHVRGLVPAVAVPLWVAGYSWIILASRCHYTADVVLSWWALAAVCAYDGGRFARS